MHRDGKQTHKSQINENVKQQVLILLPHIVLRPSPRVVSVHSEDRRRPSQTSQSTHRPERNHSHLCEIQVFWESKDTARSCFQQITNCTAYFLVGTKTV